MPPPSPHIPWPRASMRAPQNYIATWWPYVPQFWYDKRTQNQSTKRLKNHSNFYEIFNLRIFPFGPPWSVEMSEGARCSVGRRMTSSLMQVRAFLAGLLWYFIIIHDVDGRFVLQNCQLSSVAFKVSWVLGGCFDFIAKAHVAILNGREAPNHICQTWLSCVRTSGSHKWKKKFTFARCITAFQANREKKPLETNVRPSHTCILASQNGDRKSQISPFVPVSVSYEAPWGENHSICRMTSKLIACICSFRLWFKVP